MSTSEPRPGERILDVHVTEHTLVVDLADGRTISVPLAWYLRLLHATTAGLGNPVRGTEHGAPPPATREVSSRSCVVCRRDAAVRAAE
jgi:hypothetical protein